jgi:hypothetical protein
MPAPSPQARVGGDGWPDTSPPCAVLIESSKYLTIASTTNPAAFCDQFFEAANYGRRNNRTRGLASPDYLDKIIAAGQKHGLPASYLQELRRWQMPEAA